MALISRRFAKYSRLQAAAENNPPLRIGATGEPVEILQWALIDLGYPMPISTAQRTKPADGIFGAETQGVVQAFQSQQNLEPDGIVGRHTLGRLDEIFTALEAKNQALLQFESRGFFWT
jgi:peptidoglycan hydrolase-like protein with peptidoglycan-binding domain